MWVGFQNHRVLMTPSCARNIRFVKYRVEFHLEA